MFLDLTPDEFLLWAFAMAETIAPPEASELFLLHPSTGPLHQVVVRTALPPARYFDPPFEFAYAPWNDVPRCVGDVIGKAVFDVTLADPRFHDGFAVMVPPGVWPLPPKGTHLTREPPFGRHPLLAVFYGTRWVWQATRYRPADSRLPTGENLPDEPWYFARRNGERRVHDEEHRRLDWTLAELEPWAWWFDAIERRAQGVHPSVLRTEVDAGDRRALRYPELDLPGPFAHADLRSW